MNFEDERYVRVYTRDTADWLALSFDAQSLFLQLLRKVDRCGLLSLGRHGTRAVAIAINHAQAWPRLAPALDELLEDGCVVLSPDGTTIVIPNFVAAQETPTSAKARSKEHRERRKLAALGPTDPSRPVTRRHAPPTARDESSRNVTVDEPDELSVTKRDDPSRNVADRHAVKHAVTRRHTASHGVTPNRTVPNQTTTTTTSDGEREDAGARAPAHEAPLAPLGSSSSKSSPDPEDEPASDRAQEGHPGDETTQDALPDVRPVERAQTPPLRPTDLPDEYTPSGTLNAHAVLDAISTHAEDAFQRNASAQLQTALAKVVRESGYTASELRMLGAYLHHLRNLKPRPSWYDGKPFTIPRLLGSNLDGGRLVRLMSDANDWNPKRHQSRPKLAVVTAAEPTSAPEAPCVSRTSVFEQMRKRNEDRLAQQAAERAAREEEDARELERRFAQLDQRAQG